MTFDERIINSEINNQISEVRIRLVDSFYPFMYFIKGSTSIEYPVYLNRDKIPYFLESYIDPGKKESSSLISVSF